MFRREWFYNPVRFTKTFWWKHLLRNRVTRRIVSSKAILPFFYPHLMAVKLYEGHYIYFLLLEIADERSIWPSSNRKPVESPNGGGNTGITSIKGNGIGDGHSEVICRCFYFQRAASDYQRASGRAIAKLLIRFSPKWRRRHRDYKDLRK